MRLRNGGKPLAVALVLLLAFATACDGGDGAGAIGTATCDSAADHLIDVCDAPSGEDFRAVCEIEATPLVTAQDRQCVASLGACTRAALERCDVHHVTVACDVDSDCPEPFLCDAENQECVRCKADSDCDSGRGCLMGLCYDEDSAFFKTLSK
jgi:hypothetical protein